MLTILLFIFLLHPIHGFINLYMDTNETFKQIGVPSELYYVRNGIINTYATQFRVLVKADVDKLKFTWYSLGAHVQDVAYNISFTRVERNMLVRPPQLNISPSGYVPLTKTEFTVELVCNPRIEADIDFDIIFFINVVGRNVTSFKLQRKKFCLKDPNYANNPQLHEMSKDDSYENTYYSPSKHNTWMESALAAADPMPRSQNELDNYPIEYGGAYNKFQSKMPSIDNHNYIGSPLYQEGLLPSGSQYKNPSSTLTTKKNNNKRSFQINSNNIIIIIVCSALLVAMVGGLLTIFLNYANKHKQTPHHGKSVNKQGSKDGQTYLTDSLDKNGNFASNNVTSNFFAFGSGNNKKKRNKKGDDNKAGLMANKSWLFCPDAINGNGMIENHHYHHTNNNASTYKNGTLKASYNGSDLIVQTNSRNGTLSKPQSNFQPSMDVNSLRAATQYKFPGIPHKNDDIDANVLVIQPPQNFSVNPAAGLKDISLSYNTATASTMYSDKNRDYSSAQPTLDANQSHHINNPINNMTFKPLVSAPDHLSERYGGSDKHLLIKGCYVQNAYNNNHTVTTNTNANLNSVNKFYSDQNMMMVLDNSVTGNHSAKSAGIHTQTLEPNPYFDAMYHGLQEYQQLKQQKTDKGVAQSSRRQLLTGNKSLHFSDINVTSYNHQEQQQQVGNNMERKHEENLKNNDDVLLANNNNNNLIQYDISNYVMQGLPNPPPPPPNQGYQRTGYNHTQYDSNAKNADNQLPLYDERTLSSGSFRPPNSDGKNGYFNGELNINYGQINNSQQSLKRKQRMKCNATPSKNLYDTIPEESEKETAVQNEPMYIDPKSIKLGDVMLEGTFGQIRTVHLTIPDPINHQETITYSLLAKMLKTKLSLTPIQRKMFVKECAYNKFKFDEKRNNGSQNDSDDNLQQDFYNSYGKEDLIGESRLTTILGSSRFQNESEKGHTRNDSSNNNNNNMRKKRNKTKTEKSQKLICTTSDSDELVSDTNLVPKKTYPLQMCDMLIYDLTMTSNFASRTHNLNLLLNQYRDTPELFIQSNIRFSTVDFVDMAIQLLQALSTLHRKGIIHKDIAARNCYILLTPTISLKLCDTTLSRDIFPAEYSCLGDNENRPIKWMALESLLYNQYTFNSDIWSFGVTLWEIMSYGIMPYYDIDPFEMAKCLKRGMRLPQLSTCPDQIYSIILNCLDENPENRPPICDLLAYLEHFTKALDKYI